MLVGLDVFALLQFCAWKLLNNVECKGGPLLKCSLTEETTAREKGDGHRRIVLQYFHPVFPGVSFCSSCQRSAETQMFPRNAKEK